MRFSDEELHLLAAAILQREAVSRLFVTGSPAFVYTFQWTAADAAGWAATAASLTSCELKESTSNLGRKNPTLWVCEPASGQLRKIRPHHIFRKDPEDPVGAYVIRCAISPLLSDIKYLEKLIHIMLKDDIVGFKGHIKNGGSSAIQQRYVYGVSMLVIPDLGKLNLVVNEKSQ